MSVSTMCITRAPLGGALNVLMVPYDMASLGNKQKRQFAKRTYRYITDNNTLEDGSMKTDLNNN